MILFSHFTNENWGFIEVKLGEFKDLSKCGREAEAECIYKQLAVRVSHRSGSKQEYRNQECLVKQE